MPRSAREIEERMEELYERQEVLLAELGEAQDNHARLDIDRRVSFATARVTERANAHAVAGRRPTIDAVDDAAVIASGPLHYQALVANGIIQTKKEALRAVQSELDGLRSQLASHRAISN